MAMTPQELLDMNRKYLARIQEEVARLEQLLTNAKWKEKCAQEDYQAAEAVVAASQGVP
jgi:hypothetical protein